MTLIALVSLVAGVAGFVVGWMLGYSNGHWRAYQELQKPPVDPGPSMDPPYWML